MELNIFEEIDFLLEEIKDFVDTSDILKFFRYEFEYSDLLDTSSVFSVILEKSKKYPLLKSSYIFVKIDDFDSPQAIPSDINLVSFVFYVLDICQHLEYDDFYIVINQKKESVFLKKIGDDKYLVNGVFSLFLSENDDEYKKITDISKDGSIIVDAGDIFGSLYARQSLFDFIYSLKQKSKVL